jgi:hypothetical protein
MSICIRTDGTSLDIERRVLVVRGHSDVFGSADSDCIHVLNPQLSPILCVTFKCRRRHLRRARVGQVALQIARGPWLTPRNPLGAIGARPARTADGHGVRSRQQSL